ncbi:hypothetical protein BC830DRAFT_920307 [Chytriomyces sp. MP71]|nr:hypothetical protein BC830DRAFT_920307 [Chytriomyces sp. MP71]
MTSQKQQDVLQQSLKSTAATPNSTALNSVSSAKSYLQHIQQQQARANAAARLKEDGAELEEELRNTSSQAELSKALLQQQLLQQQHELARKVSLKKGDAPPPPTYVPTSSFQAVTGAAGGAQHHLSQAFHNMLIPPPPPASAVPAIPTMSLLSRDSMPPVPLNSDSSVLLQFTTNPSAQQNATPINPVKQTATMATTMSVPTVPSSTFSKATQSPAASLTSSEPVSVAPKPHSPSIVSKASNTSSGGVRGASFFKMLANLLHSSNSSHSNLTSATPTAADGSNGAVGFLNTKRKTAASSSHTTTTTPVARTNTIAATQQYLQQSYYQQQRSKSPGPPKSPASKSPGLYQPKTPRTPGGGIVGSFGFRSTSTSSTAPTAGIVYNTNTHSINNSLPPPSQHAPPQSSSFNRTPNAPTAVPSAVPYFAISKSPGGMSSCPTSPAAAVANSSIGSGLDTQAPPMPVIPAVYLQDSGGVPGAAGESVFVPSDADLRMYPGALGSAVIAAAVRSASGGGASGAPTPVPQVIRSVSPASGVGGMVGATPAATVADSTPTGQGSGNGRQLKSSLKKAASSFWG